MSAQAAALPFETSASIVRMPIARDSDAGPLETRQLDEALRAAAEGAHPSRFEALVRLGETLACNRGVAQICPILLERLEQSDLPRDERRAVLWSLSQAQNQKLRIRFRRRLVSKDERVATDAAFFAGCARDAEATPLISLTLLRHRTRKVAQTGIWALGNIGTKEAEDTLLLMLEQQVYETECIAALGQAGTHRSARLLAPYVRDIARSRRLHTLHTLTQIARRHRGLDPKLCTVLRPHLDSMASGRDPIEAKLAQALQRVL